MFAHYRKANLFPIPFSFNWTYRWATSLERECNRCNASRGNCCILFPEISSVISECVIVLWRDEERTRVKEMTVRLLSKSFRTSGRGTSYQKYIMVKTFTKTFAGNYQQFPLETHPFPIHHPAHINWRAAWPTHKSENKYLNLINA